MAKRKGRRQSAEPQSDYGTPELHRRHLIAIEGSKAVGDKPHARVMDQRPLDRYLARGLLSPDPQIAKVMFEAGDRLRADWAKAGLEPHMTGQMAPRARSGEAWSDIRVAAWERKDRALVALLEPFRACAIAVICQDEDATAWGMRHFADPRSATDAQALGMGTLKLALAQLAHHYRIGC